MVLGFIQPKTEDVATLIGRKNYTKAIELIRAQLKTQRPDPRLRLQLADVLVLAGKVPEAVTILSPLADEFAREGFAAKAISVLKKIQKLDPNRRDVDARLASLIEEKQRQATVSIPSPSALPEIGMEEIGLEMPMGGTGTSVPAPEGPPGPEPSSSQWPDGPPAAPVPVAAEPAEPVLELALEGPLESPADDATFTLEDQPVVAPLPEPPVAAPLPVVDRDLISDDDLVPVEAVDLAEEEAVTAEPDAMTESLFAAELLSLVEDAFKDVPAVGTDDALPPPPGVDGVDAGSGTQIVVSPLFKDLSVDELVAVIHGLKLLTFERSQVILREGQPGDSMYMLTAGAVRAFVKQAGRQVPLGDLSEGAFFGEVSVLTGKPRMATIVATNHCELLELDRATLDSIAARHPHVMDVLRQFAAERTRG